MELIKTIGMSFSFDDLDNTILTQIEAHFDMHFSSGRNPSGISEQRASGPVLHLTYYTISSGIRNYSGYAIARSRGIRRDMFH